MEAGESLSAAFRLLHYVSPLSPGEYSLRLVYDDNETIAPPDEYEDLVVAKSDMVPLSVKQRRVALSDAEVDQLTQQFRLLDPEEPVLLLTYGSAGVNPVIPSPQHPVEFLLAAGWKAVPVLLDVLDDEATTPPMRAWALALLYDITGLVDPESVPGAIGSATYSGFGRRVGGIGISGAFGYRAGSGLDPDDQEQLIARWRELRSLVEVER